MSPVTRAGFASVALAAAPIVPLTIGTPLAWAVYFVAVLLLWLTVNECCHTQYRDGYRAGEKAHRLSTMAEVIRLPRRAVRPYDRSAS